MPVVLSVVITAHDRKEFLFGSVKSVCEQKLQREKIEIIVVKNYSDSYIDAFLKENNVKSVLTEKKSFGEKLAIGIENCKGEIISFLDDDDLFTPNKAITLIEAFKDPALIYHHSSIITIDSSGSEYKQGITRNIGSDLTFDTGKILNFLRPVMKYKGNWYVSAMSCRLNPLKEKLELIRNSDTSLDKVVFYLMASCTGKMKLDSRQLTKYRVHPSLTTIITDKEDFTKKRSDFYNRSYNSLHKLRKTIAMVEGAEALDIELLHARLARYFFNETMDKFSLLELARICLKGLRRRLLNISYWAAMCLVMKVSKNSARSIVFMRNMAQFRKFAFRNKD